MRRNRRIHCDDNSHHDTVGNIGEEEEVVDGRRWNNPDSLHTVDADAEGTAEGTLNTQEAGTLNTDSVAPMGNQTDSVAPMGNQVVDKKIRTLRKIHQSRRWEIKLKSAFNARRQELKARKIRY